MTSTNHQGKTIELEEPLGGNVTAVVRVGDTVHREPGPWTPAVHALLKHLEHAGFSAAPRVQGFDERGREVLSFIHGEIRRQPGPWMSDAMLTRVARLLRELHQATRGFVLPEGTSWLFSQPDVPGREQVVCHNDIAPRNTAFRGEEPVAFIDWDFASPAEPSWDLAHAAWESIPLADDERCRSLGWDPLPDRPARLRTIVDAYGLDASLRPEFTDTILRRMRSTADTMEERAVAGDAAFAALVARGFPAAIRVEIAWVERHQAELTAAILA